MLFRSLVVLTADRPAELRDRGAPQTIDQDHLYGRMAKWFAEVPLFDGDPATTAHVRWIAGRAVATAGQQVVMRHCRGFELP